MEEHEPRKLFKIKLSQIASELKERDLDKLIFGCKDVIPDAEREQLNSVSSLFEELEKRGKIDVDNREFLVELLNSIGHKKLADSLQIYSERAKENIEKLKKLGRVKFKEHKFREAQDAYYDALLRLNKQHSQTDIEVAKEYLSLAIKLVRCLIQLGNENHDLSYFKQAYEVCSNELLMQDPEDFRAKFLLAESLVGLKQYEDAYKELKLLINIKPKNPNVLSLYKKVKYMGKFDQDQDEFHSSYVLPQATSFLGINIT